MKNQSKHISKVVFGLVMSLGTSAFASDEIVTAETLLKNNLEAQVIEDLLNNDILLRTQFQDHFTLNNSKVIAVLKESNDPELVQFMDRLQKLVEDHSKIKIKVPRRMIFSSQDGGSLQ